MQNKNTKYAIIGFVIITGLVFIYLTFSAQFVDKTNPNTTKQISILMSQSTSPEIQTSSSSKSSVSKKVEKTASSSISSVSLSSTSESSTSSNSQNQIQNSFQDDSTEKLIKYTKERFVINPLRNPISFQLASCMEKPESEPCEFYYVDDVSKIDEFAVHFSFSGNAKRILNTNPTRVTKYYYEFEKDTISAPIIKQSFGGTNTKNTINTVITK